MRNSRKSRVLAALYTVVICLWGSNALADAPPIADAQPTANAPHQRPNLVIIFTDDQGYADVGCYGATGFETPHLDRMAAEGMRFTDFYSAAPSCTPARAALMTGCYPQRVSMPNVIGPNARIGLNPDETTLADLLKTRGYATACYGKWHLGHDPEFLPTRHGFDEYSSRASRRSNSTPTNRS
jgi:arylsulfatase A